MGTGEKPDESGISIRQAVFATEDEPQMPEGWTPEEEAGVGAGKGQSSKGGGGASRKK